MRPISPEEFASFRQTMQQREAQAQQRLAERLTLALQVAEMAATVLKCDFQATQVLLFGSLIEQNLFHPTSDIDLAVSGLAPLDYFTAVAKLQDLSPFKIDLVRLESCKPSLKAAINAEGREL